MLGGKPPQFSLGIARKANLDLPAVFSAANPFHQPSASEAIHQADGTVVLDQEMASQVPDGWTAVLLPGADRQQHLMLLRLETFVFGRCLAEVQKAADLAPEGRQGVIVREWQIVLGYRHGSLASGRKCPFK
jgi:hypothetical protein